MDPKIWGIPEARCVIVEQPSSAAQLVNPIYEAAEDTTDTLLFYYAGHGLTALPNDELLLALPGTEIGRPYTSVRFDDVRAAILSAYGAPNKVVILDCCFSGRAMAGQMSDSTSLAARSSIEGTYLLTAAAETKTALAPPGEQYTAFTGELIRLLRTGIRQGPKLLDLDTIYDRLKTELASRSRPVPQQRNRNSGAWVALGRNVVFKEPSRYSSKFDIDATRRRIHALHLTEYERIRDIDLLVKHAPAYTGECIAVLDEILGGPGLSGVSQVSALEMLARISDERKPQATRQLTALADGSATKSTIVQIRASEALAALGPEYKMKSINGFRSILAKDYDTMRLYAVDKFARTWPECVDEIRDLLWSIANDEARNRKDRISSLRKIAQIDASAQESIDAALRALQGTVTDASND